MKKYFKEKLIWVLDDDGERLEFFMRPIKIKELQLIRRVVDLTEEGKSEEFTTPVLLGLLRKTLSISTANIPIETMEKLTNTLIEYNFPGINKDETAERKAKEEDKRDLVYYIDFLVTQGHRVSDIMDYTITQFNDLIRAACDRLSGHKKPMDPMAAFQKLGIPIKRKDNGRQS